MKDCNQGLVGYALLRSMVIKSRELSDELKNIRSIELAYSSKNVVLMFVWTILGLIGIAWAFYLFPNNYDVWKHNPSIISKANLDLRQIDYPAISISVPGVTKYALAERLGNYIQPKKLPIQIRKLRNLLWKCSTPISSDKINTDKEYYDYYIDNCVFSSSFNKIEKKVCEVSYLDNLS